MKKPYTSLGNDLYCDAGKCTCTDPKWKDSEVAHLFQTRIKLTGYYDNNFFNNVHKEPHKGKCHCGRGFEFQWFRDGVVFNWTKEN